MIMYKKKTPTSCPPCDAPACAQDGLYRAPQSRDHLFQYYWFCLKHIRAYNARWNYYAGLPLDEIERLNTDDLGGRRPTWPLGQWGSKGQQYVEDLRTELHRTFDINVGGTHKSTHPVESLLTREEKQAAKTLELTIPFTAQHVKAHYLKLVKKFHPDRHVTSPHTKQAAEEMFKQISAAYEVLRRKP